MGIRVLAAGRLPLAGAALGLVALAGCGGGGSKGAIPSTDGATEAATESGGMQTLTVQADDAMSFKETHLTAHVGAVQITLQVPGVVPHDLIFTDGPTGGTSEISQGSASTIRMFNRPGVYHFLCTIHPNMTGTLTITQ